MRSLPRALVLALREVEGLGGGLPAMESAALDRVLPFVMSRQLHFHRLLHAGRALGSWPWAPPLL
jgi:hypothetical protein